MLKLNQQTVRNMIDRGDLGAVRVGKRRVRVRQSQLDAFLAAGAMTHETDPAAAAGLDEDPWRGSPGSGGRRGDRRADAGSGCPRAGAARPDEGYPQGGA